MGDETKENPYTREDVIRLIKEHDGTADGLDLSNRRFMEVIDLSDLDLHGIILNDVHLFRANFNGSNLDRGIMQRANLGYATFNPLESKAASLQGIDLRGANLHDAEFRGADLTGAQLQEELPQLLPAFLDRTDLRGTNLFRTNFKGCRFYGTKLEGACIRGADITTDTFLGDADWGNYIIGEEKKNDFYSAEYRYRHLKVWYSENGYDDTAAKFRYREIESRRKKLKLLSKNWNHRITLQLSYLVFGHGEGWKRILIWIVGVIFVLAAAYYFWGSFSSSSFWDILYYSATSFTALGYGKWAPQPTGWAKGMGAAEAIIGVFMMALLLVTFVRKWTR